MEYLSNLVNKSEKELSKIAKPDLVKSIIGSKWQFDSAKNTEKDLKDKLEKQSSDELAMKKLVAAMVDVEMPKNDYSDDIEWNKVDLSTLVGALISKNLDLLAGK